MKITVKEDITARTIRLDIVDGPELEDTTSRIKPRPFRADRLRIALTDSTIHSVQVSGYLILKGGRLSDSTRDSMSWHPGSWSRDRLDEAPTWVRTVLKEVLEGATSWDWPVLEGATSWDWPEVQAL